MLAALVGALIVAAVGASYGVYRALPMFTDEELQEADEMLAAERAALTQTTCERAPLGEAEPTVQAAFSALLEGERWAEEGAGSRET